MNGTNRREEDSLDALEERERRELLALRPSLYSSAVPRWLQHRLDELEERQAKRRREAEEQAKSAEEWRRFRKEHPIGAALCLAFGFAVAVALILVTLVGGLIFLSFVLLGAFAGGAFGG